LGKVENLKGFQP